MLQCSSCLVSSRDICFTHVITSTIITTPIIPLLLLVVGMFSILWSKNSGQSSCFLLSRNSRLPIILVVAVLLLLAVMVVDTNIAVPPQLLQRYYTTNVHRSLLSIVEFLIEFVSIIVVDYRRQCYHSGAC